MITKDTKVVEALQIDRRTALVFQSYGMGCIHCLAANVESIEEACAAHGINLDEMLEKLNSVAQQG
ncbi:MAG: DUF1858 domain-containing protein [Clostridia bacterium]|nr:DUF1858 domain-containing protein [Clostridia bacterium]